MGGLGGLIKMLLVYALFCSPFVWYYFRTQKKKREAIEKEKARRETLRLERERREAAGRRAGEEAARIQKEKLDAAYAEYDRIMESLEVFPVEVSEEKAEKLKIAAVNELTYSTITPKTNWIELGDFVVVDTETTGLDPISDEIIEIAAIRFRGFQPTAKFSTLLAPVKGPVLETATRINRITNEMVAGKPCFQEIASSFLDFMGSDNLVGHNLPFDLKFIVHYGADVTKTRRKYFDTLALAQRTIKKQETKRVWDKELGCYVEDMTCEGISNYKLDTLRSYLGIVARETHRAEADAMSAGVLFEMLAQMRIG